MLASSLIALVCGSSIGPEGPVLVFMASIVGLLEERFLRQGVRVKRILSLCAMSGAISGFFGLPLAGAIFVLEVPHRMGLQYYEALTPAIVSSVTAVLVSASIERKHLYSGVYAFRAAPSLQAYYLLLGVPFGLLGAMLAALFVVLYWLVKRLVHRWHGRFHPFALALVGGFLLGGCAALMPHVLFWGEYELGGLLLKSNVPPHISPLLRGIIPIEPESAAYLLGLGFLKLIAILVVLCAGWPGGVFFPLLFAGGSAGMALSKLLPQAAAAIAVPCLMAAVEVAIMRTPWAANLTILLLSLSTSRPLEVFPVVTVAAYTALFVTRKLRLYPASAQRSRTDVTSRERPENPALSAAGAARNPYVDTTGLDDLPQLGDGDDDLGIPEPDLPVGPVANPLEEAARGAPSRP
jgi:H+/Cl- antiporter ClcA